MKILMVNKFHYLKGGSEKYYFELAELLREKGNEVAFFSMEDEKNIHTDCKEYFVKPIDLNSNNKLKALDVIYSKENQKKFEEALDDFKPDIVHLNNFQRQLSASIIKPIKKRKIPIVFTAHDLQAICPNITMLDSNCKICEKCQNGKYINCVKNKCIKNSNLKSLLGAIEGRYYRKNKIYEKQIDAIITPSNFYKEKLKKDGIDEKKIYAIHNFIDTTKYNTENIDNGYAFYLGRLSREKGILNLVEAFSKIEKGKLYIAGDGPERENIEKIIKEKKLDEKIKLLGYLTQDKVKEYVSKCKFIVIPSIWYENCPYSVLETIAIGKPIIGSDIAGIPELVEENINGLLYNTDNTEELASKMELLFNNNELCEKFGKASKKLAKEKYDKDIYYNNIINIYKNLLREKK